MKLRDAKQADLPAIADIWNREIAAGVATFTSEKKNVESLAALLSECRAAGRGFLVADQDGALLGFALYGPFRAGPGYVHTAEHTVYVAPSATGRGTGRALMEELEATARAAGVHVMVAAVSAENHAAITFHQHLGYREVARMPEVGRKFSRWLDLVLLQKRI